jgi:hypothetical protein
MLDEVMAITDLLSLVTYRPHAICPVFSHELRDAFRANKHEKSGDDSRLMMIKCMDRAFEGIGR